MSQSDSQSMFTTASTTPPSSVKGKDADVQALVISSVRMQITDFVAQSTYTVLLNFSAP